MLAMLPGMANKAIPEDQLDERLIDRNAAIIRSMTKAERQNPAILNASRRRRIAAGSGTMVQDVNRLIRQFEETRK
jgi:signal recognition particle subunit SRP54